jgi:XTP/dITP diphosphohydrolase
MKGKVETTAQIFARYQQSAAGRLRYELAQQNLAKLLEELRGQEDDRLAYVCAIALVGPDGAESVFEAGCTGRLAPEPRGDGGFGYDPAFIPDDTGPGDDRTMAELSPEEKHAISHRGRAARLLAESLGVAS